MIIKGNRIFIDDIFRSEIEKYSWVLQKNRCNTYIVTTVVTGKKVIKDKTIYIKKKIYLHRLIAELAGLDLKGKMVDHINMDTFDNRLSNLRLATPSQNRINSVKSNSNTGYLGITMVMSKDKKRKYYYASVGNRYICCKSLDEAIKTRNEHCTAKYGEFYRAI